MPCARRCWVCKLRNGVAVHYTVDAGAAVEVHGALRQLVSYIATTSVIINVDSICCLKNRKLKTLKTLKFSGPEPYHAFTCFQFNIDIFAVNLFAVMNY
jgi:hypothetical protein